MPMKGYEALPVEQCGTCAHFRRHYIRMAGNCYFPISYGHCVYPARKKRREEECCSYWCAANYESTPTARDSWDDSTEESRNFYKNP